MFLSILIVTAIFLVLFLIQRYRKQMAALIAWIIGSIVNKKAVEEKPPDRSKQNQKNKKKLKESNLKSANEVIKQSLHVASNYESSKTSDSDLKSNKRKSNKKTSSSLSKISDDQSQNSSSGILLEKLKGENNIEKIVTYTETTIQLKQGKSNKKKSKSADKLQNVTDLIGTNLNDESFKFQEKKQLLNIQKSKSLPNFQKSLESNRSTLVPKKEDNKRISQTSKPNENKTNYKESSTSNVAILKEKKEIVENSLLLLESDNIKSDTFVTVSHKRQSNKKSTSENLIQVDASKQVSDKKRLISNQVDKALFTKNTTKSVDVETKKQELSNREIHFNKNQNTEVPSRNLPKLEILQDSANNQHSYQTDKKDNANLTKLIDVESSKNQPKNFSKLSKFEANYDKLNSQTVPVTKHTEVKRLVSFSKEALISRELKQPQKLRKVQSETEIIVKKLSQPVLQNKPNLKDLLLTEEIPAVLHTLDFRKILPEIKQAKPITKEALVEPEVKTNKSKAEYSQGKNQIDIEQAQPTAVVVKEKTDLALLKKDTKQQDSFYNQQKELELKSNNTLATEVHSKNIVPKHQILTEGKKATLAKQEEVLELKQNKKEDLTTSLAHESNIEVTNESSDTSNNKTDRLERSVTQETTIKHITTNKDKKDNLPPSAIIEHFKSKYKGPETPGVLLQSSVGLSKPLTSDKLSLPLKASVGKISEGSLLDKNPTITMKSVTQVRVLTLNDNEHQESTLYRIEKNWVLQFRLGSSLLGRKVALYCNYPELRNGILTEFDRNKYYLLSWNQDEGCSNSDDTSLFAHISVKVAGSFHYYFVYENATESGPQGSGYFLVDPVLQYGNEEELPLNCIQCQTVLSKCLGSFSTWENKLRVSKESGYNMIHFTPIQELGKSNSAYSLSSQLKLNPTFNNDSTKISFEDVEKLLSKIRSEWKVLSICDIVLNHTANETDWLQEHPEGTYNCFTCPYMRPAYLLDAAFAKFSEDVKNGLYETMGIPPEVDSEEHLNSIRYSLQTKVIKEINIPELFICEVNKLISQFQDLARKTPPAESKKSDKSLKLVQDPSYHRMASGVDMNLALKLYNVYRQDTFDEDARIKRCSEEFKNELDKLNKNITNEINNHLHAAIENVIEGIRYFRVQNDGPKIKDISVKNPLCSRYFTDYGTPKSIKEYEDIMYSPNSKYLMAHNGWVMNADPMRNFADPDSCVYIRRELIAWGDSVKLRYGDKPEDCPFLWNHMRAYVEQTARVFDGVRLDNCHSTPIPVAEYLLDCARKVRPNLYVVAELFTNSDQTDNVFVNRLGITSLIREAMSAWDSHEEGRLVHRYGGDPVGAFFQPHCRPLVPSIAHALFLDLTHDNPSPVQKRSVFDLLPSSALVNMACCASGSNRGYDELVNHHIHVVDEDREYTEWTNDTRLALENPRHVSTNSGIILAKKCINDLHFKLGIEGFSQVYVDQIDPDIVAVTRHRPQTHESVILVAFTAFAHPRLSASNFQRGIKPLRVEGVLEEIILEATLSHVSKGKVSSKFGNPENFIQDQKWINGLSEYQVDVKEHIQLKNSDVFELANSGSPNIVQLNFKNFKPGSIVAIRVSLQKHVQECINKLRETMSVISKKSSTDLSNIINKLNLSDLNRVLYRCEQEEKDEGNGFSTYNIPNFGSLVYCGLQGFISLLSTIRPSNDLGHPMCGNLRDGNWMVDYISQRLKMDDGTKELGKWIDKNIEPLKNIPRYLVPSYFDVAVTSLYILLLEQSYHLMSGFVKNGSAFVKGLSLGSLQFAAVIRSADLPLLSPNLSPPKPLTKINNHGHMVQSCVTLSAGLPHFSVGYMRNWGRDTFIALRGLFILTGRVEDARYHILGYAACLRHGLIPNLLDAGKNSRFNCRDAVWWWLYCIKSYVDAVPDGIKILSDKVSRIFPTDDSSAQQPGVADQPLYEVIQESLKVHFQGLAFRERNAGRQIDAHMTDKGFNNQIGVHPETGFVFGGNEFNCGTWMDKMGSSDKAGNRGKPATPRDGSAIELIGLSKAVVTWLGNLHKANQYPYAGVERVNKNGGSTKWTFNEWSEKIQNNFEKYFWINLSSSPGEATPELINKRGIYKDSYGATQGWADFQLRCNFPIAMVAAPELFNAKHAWISLQMTEKYLLGPLGMKTLDPEDWKYCGDYNNADDSNNVKTANGFNYHQGPEWVWPVGYYLRAKLQFATENGELARTIANVKVILSKHFTELQTSPWRGLPELTNSNGSFCNDSSRTQAWSMACILEVLHDLQQIESRQNQLKSN